MADKWYYAGYSGSASTGKTLKMHLYTIETNVVENYTVERADLIMEVSNAVGGYWNNYGSPAYVGINGNNTTRNVDWDARSTGDKWLIGSWDTRIYHDPNGSKSIGISFSHTTDTLLGNAVNSGDTYVCDTIPRQAIITAASDFNDEENPTINYSNPAGNSISTLQACISLTGVSADISYRDISKTGTSYTFDLTTEERNVLRKACTTSNSRKVIFFVRTTIGENTFHSTLERTLTIVNANPSFNNFKFEDINAKSVALTGDNQKLIKNYSNVEAIVNVANKAVAQKMATMSKYRLQIGTKQVDTNYSDNSDVSLTLDKVDNNVIRVYAIDSRNNSTAKDLSPSAFIEYTDIKILEASVSRENGGVGSIVTLNLNGEFWNDNFGNVTNTIKTLEVQYKSTISDEWLAGDTITPKVSQNSFSFQGAIKGDLGANGFDVNNSYDIRIAVEDELSTFFFTTTLGSGKPAIAICSKGTSFGAPYNEEIGGVLQIEGEYSVLKEKVLYENASGSTGTISLTTPAENYKYIEIFARYGTAYYTSVKIANPNGKYFNIVAGMMNQTVSFGYVTATNYSISGATITPVYYGEWNLYNGTFSGDNKISITKIVGYS